MARIVPEDLHRLTWVKDPQVSPDGRTVVYVTTCVDVKPQAGPSEPRYRQTLAWVASTGQVEPRALTVVGNDRSPRWSPDGARLAFLSDRAGSKPQLYVIERQGGEARPLTDLSEGAGVPVWAPNGQHIAFAAKAGPVPERPAWAAADVRVVDRLPYKLNGVGFLNPVRKAQIHIMAVAGGEIQQLTQHDQDCGQPAWSPDGAFLAYATSDPLSGQATIWVLAPQGGGPRALVLTEGGASDLAFSPDGRWLTYVGHDNAYRGATQAGVWLVPVEGGAPRCLTAGFDRPVGGGVGSDMHGGEALAGPVWTPDGSHLLFPALDAGRVHLFAVGVQGPAQLGVPVQRGATVHRLVGGDRALVGLSWTASRTAYAAVVSTPTQVGEVYYGTLEGEERQLTHLNQAVENAWELSQPRSFVCSADPEWPIQGWYLPPVGVTPGTKHPLILEIHGGPHSAYGEAFFMEMQLLAAAGFGVVYANPRGSTGYGQGFAAATRHDWGGGDYRDLMAVVDWVLTHVPEVDGARLGVTGGSYGGYMTNWILGHNDRFRAGVTDRSTSNRYSQFGASDYGFHNGDFEFPGPPWEAAEFYLAHSPIAYVANIRAPLLLIHGEEDLRCPIEEAEQLFTALKTLGREAVLVRYPGENHELPRSGRPDHRVDRLYRIVRWFDPSSTVEGTWQGPPSCSHAALRVFDTGNTQKLLGTQFALIRQEAQGHL